MSYRKNGGKMPQIDRSLAKKAIKLAFFLALFMTIYINILKYELGWLYLGLYILEGLLFCAVFLLTRGFSKKPPSADDFSPDLTADELSRRIERAARRRELGLRLVYPLVTLSPVIMFDIVWATFF